LNELRAVLNADAIEKQEQPDRAHHARGRRPGRDGADGQACEQHGADTEGESLDGELPQQVPAADREKQRQKRLRLEKIANGVHAGSKDARALPLRPRDAAW